MNNDLQLLTAQLKRHTNEHLELPEVFYESRRITMIATELGSISSANHRYSLLCCSVFASNRPGQRAFDPCWAPESLGSSLSEIDDPLEIVANGHHRHGEVGPRLSDGAQRRLAR